MTYKQIVLSYKNHIATITLNRPDKLNAISPMMRKELFLALQEVNNNNDVRVLVLAGNGRAFCAGGDIEYLHKLRTSNDISSFKELLAQVKQLALNIHNMPVPVIAGINGAAAGAGLNLAMACDICLASENASFGATFTKLGLHPDWGNTFFLPKTVGTAKSCEMLFTGDMISADDALKWGLVNRIVPSRELHSAVLSIAEKIAANPPLAVRRTKRAIYDAACRNLSEMLDMEEEAQLQIFQSKDALEGIIAFLEKRKPAFTGK